MAAYAFGLSYILVGILVCLVFVAVSDWGASNSTIFIYDEFELGDKKEFDVADLLSATEAAEKRNDDMFAVKGIALKTAELAEALCRHIGIHGKESLVVDELLYALSIADKEGLIFVRGGLLTRGFNPRALAARRIYDAWAADDSIKLAPGPDKFLETNRIGLRGGGAADLREVTLMPASERPDFLSMLETFSCEGAKALLSVLDGRLKVVVF